MIKSLQSLRGIFAIIIVIYHYYDRSLPVVTAMACGVSFFFIMSGFALGIHHPVSSLKGFGFMAFMRNRLAKVYPIHLMLTLAMVVFLGIGWKLWVNVLLLQSWFPQHDVWFSYNGVSWFVASLVFCYLFYGVFSYWSLRQRPAVSFGVIAAAAIALMAAILLVPSDSQRWFYHVFPLSRLIDFALGVVLARIYKTPSLKITSRTSTWLAEACLAIILVIILAPRVHGIPRPFYLSVVWFIPLSLLIIALGRGEQQGTALTRILSWKPLVWLGGISFEIYMLQVIVSILVGKLAAIILGHSFHPIVYITIILVLVITISWFTHSYFSTPIARRLKRK